MTFLFVFLSEYLSITNDFFPLSIAMRAPHENQWTKTVRKEITLIRQNLSLFT